MRGKRLLCFIGIARRRITPAYAGKTLQSNVLTSFFTDHPRVCGENLSPKPLRLTSTGSPPRMRGKPRRTFTRQRGHGITPAYAGKTIAAAGDCTAPWDHPRVCGENRGAYLRGSAGIGSPPRMRGKPDTPADETEQDRITPADAGKTCFPMELCPARQDHPRGCGENSSTCCR